MAKLRLLVWLVVVGTAAVLLLGDLGWSTGDPAVATMSVVRAVAGSLAAYLTVATLAALASVPLPRPAFVQRLVAGALAGGMLVAPASAGAAEVPPAPPRAEAPVLRRLDAPPPEVTTAAPVPRPPTAAPPAAAAPASSKVVVLPGDHLWAIAHRAVAAQLGREPHDDEVAVYWRQVVAANRDRLASRDPDVIFAGEVITLP